MDRKVLVGSTPTSSTMPRHKLPDKDFEWVSSLAYVVGLIATDGSISASGRHITMLSSDKELLRTFCQCLHLSPKKIKQRSPTGFCTDPNHSYKYKPAYRIQFGNVQLYRWLVRIGIFPNKTYTLGAIKVPDIYFRDCFRGELDGDGSIYTYIDRYLTHKNPSYIYQRLYVKFYSASEKHMKWLQQKTHQLLGVKGALIEEQTKRKNRAPLWRLKYSKKESIRLLNWIYYQSNLPCLKRKYKIAKPFLKQT